MTATHKNATLAGERADDIPVSKGSVPIGASLSRFVRRYSTDTNREPTNPQEREQERNKTEQAVPAHPDSVSESVTSLPF